MAKAKKAGKVVVLAVNETAKQKAAREATVAPVAVVTEVASVATKLTKRNSTPLKGTIVLTDKVARNRAGHNAAAWDALVKILPATAEAICKLPELANPACNSPQAFLSYLIRRGNLKLQD